MWLIWVIIGYKVLNLTMEVLNDYYSHKLAEEEKLEEEAFIQRMTDRLYPEFEQEFMPQLEELLEENNIHIENDI